MVRRYSLPDLRPDHLPVLHVGHQAERLSKGRAFRGAALFCFPAQGTCPAGSRRRETPATLKRACSPALDADIPGDMPGSPLPHSLSRFSPLSAGLCSAALKTESDEKRDYRGHSSHHQHRGEPVARPSRSCGMFSPISYRRCRLFARLPFRRRASVLLPTEKRTQPSDRKSTKESRQDDKHIVPGVRKLPPPDSKTPGSGRT